MYIMKKLTVQQEEWIKEKVESMSLKEKIGQLLCVSFSDLLREGSSKRQDRTFEEYKAIIDRALEKYPRGNIFVGAEVIHSAEGGVEVFHDLIAYMQEKSDIPMLVAADIESGVGAAFSQMTNFPQNITFSINGDEQAAYEVGALIAKEARAIGINWSFGPVVDMPAPGSMNDASMRCFAENVEDTLKYAKPYSQGMQDHGVAACAKHFPDGDGSCDRNSHIALTENTMSEEEWMATVGRLYKELSEAGVASVMTGHAGLAWVEEYDKENCGYCPTTISKNAVQKLLRDKLGFDGVIVTDAISMAGLSNWKTSRERTPAMFNAGVDMMLFARDIEIAYIEEAISNGEIPMERVDESVTRILRLKHMLGLFDAVDTFDQLPQIQEEAKELNRRLSEKAITCVRNKQNLLPLSKDKIKRILVLGLTHDANSGPVGEFIEKLKERGFQLDIYDVNDFANWDVEPEMKIRVRSGEQWDACFWVYDYAYIGDYRPTGLITQTLFRVSNLEGLSPILISLATPYLLEDIPSAKTYVTTMYSRSDFAMESLMKALFGEIEFNYNLPLETLRKRVD